MEAKIGRLGKGLLIAAVLLVVIASAWQVASDYFSSDHVSLRLGDGSFSARVVSKGIDRVRGLSGTKSLPDGEAMLFVFEHDARWSIWMKDMNYSIDIVWLDESKSVVDIVEGASPESYPKKFIPKRQARYVVEFASGTVESRNINIGQSAEFALAQEAA